MSQMRRQSDYMPQEIIHKERGHRPPVQNCDLLPLWHARHSAGSACSAPLRQLKMLPTAPPVAKPAVTHQSSMSSPRAKVKHAAVPPPKPSKPRKKRKSLFRKFAEEAFDFAEDAFDFVEDIFD
jgi:hypothetical protein